MCKRLTLSLVLVVLCAPLAHAQLPVVDVADIAQNTITAIESVLTTIQTILIDRFNRPGRAGAKQTFQRSFRGCAIRICERTSRP